METLDHEAETEPTPLPPETEPADLRIGPYRVLKELGRGGMGRVYLAARADEQYQKRVAIKVIKTDVDGTEVVSRFRRERQILASLDHPNISRFLDGGATEDGRPYFVMEYVEGLGIDQYCVRHDLSISERVGLFRQLCSAVEYAHRNLIVHRDIKPRNILVTSDGVPKLLDFGIAKFINFDLAGDGGTMTALAMTPQYASPEQARGEPVTTLSDVYSLGVLLYLILTGRLPYRFKSSQTMDVLRAVCEEEPERPSTAVGRPEKAEGEPTDGETIRATKRNPDELRRRLAGDLDTILLMALRKEPSRRYPSVEAFSEDLRRYLEGLPIKARKATFSYRAGKFLSRNWPGVAAGVVVAALIAGFATSTVLQSRRLQVERDRAARVSSFLVDVFNVSNPGEARGNTVTAREILDKGAERIRHELKDEPEVRATLMDTMGNVYNELGLYDQAEALLREALETRRQILTRDSPEMAASLASLAKVHYRRNDYEAAEARYRDALAMLRRLFGNDHAEIAETLNFLGLTVAERGRYDEAETLLRESVAMRRRLPAGEQPDLAMALTGLAGVLDDKKDPVAAEGVDREALAMLRRQFGNTHPAVPYTLNVLGEVLSHQGRLADAENAFRESLEISRKILPADHVYIFAATLGLGRTLTGQGKAAQAEGVLREGLAIGQRILPLDASDVLRTETALGRCLARLGRFAEAESVFVKVFETLKVKQPDGPAALEARQDLFELYRAWGQLEKARRFAAP